MPDTPETDREWLVNQVAHALRNPIFAASVQTETLHLKAGDPEAVRIAADKLHGQLQRLSSNIDEMLLFGRPLRTQLAEVPVAELVSALSERYRLGDRQDPAQVESGEIDPSLSGRWDRSAVTVILERILDNAVQHTEPPHTIRIDARRDGDDSIILSVADTGDGIDPKILERVLLPFFPQHSGRQGLGLAIADKFARVHGGRIEVESSPGHGTTVSCVLPIRVAE